MRGLRLLLTVAALTAVGVAASLLLGQPEPAAADPAGVVLDSGSGEGRCPPHLKVGEYTCTETPTTKPVDMPTHERAPHTTFWQKKKVTTEKHCTPIPFFGGEYCTTREVITWGPVYPRPSCRIYRSRGEIGCNHTGSATVRYFGHFPDPPIYPNPVMGPGPPETRWSHSWVRRKGPHSNCGSSGVEVWMHPSQPGGCPTDPVEEVKDPPKAVCFAGSDHAGEPEANASRCPHPLARWITWH